MSLDYPRVTHCQQADPSVKVSLYAKVTLDVPGLSKGDLRQQADPSVKVSMYSKVALDIPGLSKRDPLPAGRSLSHSIPVCPSYLGHPWIMQE